MQGILCTIAERIDLIWEDMEVPFAWAKFLEYIMKSHNSQIFDDGSITWNSFIAQTGRNRFLTLALNKCIRFFLTL